MLPKNQPSSLPVQILLAMPALEDPYFKQSVILLCNYTTEGAMGFVLNSPSTLTVGEFLKDLGCEDWSGYSESILIGGPVQTSLCWMVHSDDLQGETTTVLKKELAISSGGEMLNNLNEKRSPSRYALGLGYAGWGAKQLDREIMEDSWWLLDLDVWKLMEQPHELRWEWGMDHMGVKF